MGEERKLDVRGLGIKFVADEKRVAASTSGLSIS
jgi:hypothetical protein